MEVNIYSAILRIITTRQDDIKSVIMDGNVENCDRYQFLVGQLPSLRKLDTDIRDLFRKWEVDDDVTDGADNAKRKKDSGDKTR